MVATGELDLDIRRAGVGVSDFREAQAGDVLPHLEGVLQSFAARVGGHVQGACSHSEGE